MARSWKALGYVGVEVTDLSVDWEKKEEEMREKYGKGELIAIAPDLIGYFIGKVRHGSN